MIGAPQFLDTSGTVVDVRQRTHRGDASAEQATLDAYAAELATTARDVGQDRAAAGDVAWFDIALAWIKDLPVGSRFDADDLRLALGRSSAADGVFATARRRGLITTVDIGISRRWKRLP